jgi:hypothetical protein
VNKPNYRKLTNGHGYVVRTQAGFNQAIKDWVGDEKFIYKDDHFHFPTKYPSVVFFYSYYKGADYYNCTCDPLDKYLEHLKAQVEELEGE